MHGKEAHMEQVWISNYGGADVWKRKIEVVLLGTASTWRYESTGIRSRK